LEREGSRRVERESGRWIFPRVKAQQRGEDLVEKGRWVGGRDLKNHSVWRRRIHEGLREEVVGSLL